MKLSEFVKKYREENNLSQRELARRCDLSHGLISLIEKDTNPQTGKPMRQDIETYSKLADGMGMTVQELFQKLGDGAALKLDIMCAGGPMSIQFHDSVFDMLESKMTPEDIELEELWPSASVPARRAALAVLRSMKEGDD